MTEKTNSINISEETYDNMNIINQNTISNLIKERKINSDNINNTIKDNKTILEIAFENNLFLSVKELLTIKNIDKTKIKKEFIENALMYACENCNIELLNLLIESFEKDKIKTIFKDSDKKIYFLYYFIQQEKLDIFTKTIGIFKKALTDREIRDIINSPDDKGMTPFMYACQSGNKDIIQILFNLGANLELVDKRGFNALDIFELFNVDNYDYENDDVYKEIKQILNKLNTKNNNTQLIKELKDKLYCVNYNNHEGSISLRHMTFKLKQFGVDLNFFKHLIIEYQKNKKNPEQQTLINRIIFCNIQNEKDIPKLEKTIHELQQKIGNSDEIYYIRLDDNVHNCSIAISKDTIFYMDSLIGWYGKILNDIKLNNGTKLFAIGDYIQTDKFSCGIFSLETVATLDAYLRENNRTLRSFVEEISSKKENFKNKECPAKTIDNCIMTPIPSIFAHLIQRSLETIDQMFKKELSKNLTVNIVDKIDSPRIKITQQQSIKENSFEIGNDKFANNYLNKNREIVVYNLTTETKYIKREEFYQKIENYKNNKIKLDNIEKDVNKFKMFLGYSNEFDVIIEQNKHGKTQIFTTKATEKHTDSFINKVKRNIIICEKTENNELIFKFSDKYINKYDNTLNISNILKSIKLDNIDNNNDTTSKIYEEFINKNGIIKFIEQYATKTKLNKSQRNILIEFDKKLIERAQNQI